MISAEQKTIYTTFDEVSRMKDFCSDKDENGVRIVSKNFYDWYLKEDTFFIPYGVFIMEGLFSPESKQKFVCAFNFEDANCSKFEIINYLTQKSVIVFFFYREHNLDMNKIKVHIKELHSQNLDLIAAFNSPAHETFIKDNVSKQELNSEFIMPEKTKNVIQKIKEFIFSLFIK